MGGYGSSPFHWKLEDTATGSTNEVLPVDRFNVGGFWVTFAGILLPLEFTMFRVVKLDDQSPHEPFVHFHIDELTSTPIGQSVKSVDVVHQHNLHAYLQLEDCLEWGVHDTSGVVYLEGFYGLAVIFCLYGVERSIYLIELGFVAGVHLGIGAINVECGAV